MEDLAILINTTITHVKQTDEEIVFTLKDGRTATFLHYQACCEDVHIDDVNGDWDDLLNTPLLVAEERVDTGDCLTWTFYTFRTVKGSVDVRWFGTSNGYYSESVDFKIEGTPNMPRLNEEQRALAITARVNGDFDSPYLKFLGPLTTMTQDVQRILDTPSVTYKVAFSLTFEVPGALTTSGQDLSRDQIMKAIIERVHDLRNSSDPIPLASFDYFEEA